MEKNLTDEILDNYKKLARSKFTWAIRYDVYKYTTRFLIVKEEHIGYLLYLEQNNKKVLIQQLFTSKQVEDLYKVLTGGEILK
jgi:hypothetical protein